MATPNLNLTHLLVSQNNKEASVNLIADGLDNAQNAVLTKAVTGTVVITEAELRGYGLLQLTGTPGSDFLVSIPADIERRWAVLNQTDADAVMEIFDAGTDAVTVATGTLAVIHSDGLDLYSSSAGGVSSGGGSNNQEQSAVTSSRDLTNADLSGNKVLRLNSSSARDIYIVSGLTGTEPVTCIQTGTGQFTFQEQSGVILIASGGRVKTTGLGAAVTLLPDTSVSDKYYLFGDLELA